MPLATASQILAPKIRGLRPTKGSKTTARPPNTSPENQGIKTFPIAVINSYPGQILAPKIRGLRLLAQVERGQVGRQILAPKIRGLRPLHTLKLA